jgi:hypothetical protein
MNRALYGRVVFGASAVLFGVIALMWHDADTWQNLQHIWSLPFGTIIGGCLMAAQIAGGIGVLYPRTARLASIVLCIGYLCFSLACLPDIIAASNIYDVLVRFAPLSTLTCGASRCSSRSPRRTVRDHPDSGYPRQVWRHSHPVVVDDGQDR